MFSSTFALLNRSFREDSRLARAHLFRLVFVALILWLLYSTCNEAQFLSAPGLRFFSAITYLNVWLISLASSSFFATAITEEKEEQTLGLLLMAGIGPLGLLLGKSTSRLVTGVLLLSVQFPFTLLAITLGGVTGSQVLAAYFALVAYLFFAGNVGLFCSVVCGRSSSASKLAMTLLALFFFAPMILEEIFSGWSNAGWIRGIGLTGWLQMSVWNRLDQILQSGFAESPLCWQVLSNFVLGGVCFVAAWALFPRFTAGTESATLDRGLVSTVKSRFRFLRPGRTWNNALIWKDYHFIAGGHLWLLLRILALGILCWWIGPPPFYASASSNAFSEWGWQLCAWMLVAVTVDAASLSAQVFQMEARLKTLSGLLLLPECTSRIAYAKVIGCAIGLIPAWAGFCCGAAIALCSLLPEFRNSNGEAMLIMCSVFANMCSGFLLFFHLVALISLSVRWWSIPAAALLLWGWYFAFFMTCLSPMFFSSDTEGGIVILCLMHAGVNFAGIVMSQQMIRKRLEAVAAE